MLKKIFNIFLYMFAAIGLFFTAGYIFLRLGWTNTGGVIDTQREDFLSGSATTTPYFWETLPEWQTLQAAITKDIPILERVSRDTGVPARTLVSALVVEQLRFFYTDRESFKKFFEPLKILGSQSQFSWGVMGVKEETAVQIENNLKNPASPFYPGPAYTHLLDFKTANITQERFTRMTDQHDHYWSYLYAGLYIKEVEAQWKATGFDISGEPDILATLFNVGFANSRPNADPHSGGAEIQIYDHTYSFGSLAGEFYTSNEFVSEFPR